MSLIFAFLGLYTLVLASQQETSHLIEKVASFSCVFFIPAVLCYVLGLTSKEKSENK